MNQTKDIEWTREEFKAYLLLYMANANYFEVREEKDKILSMVNPTVYNRVYRELNKDDDVQSIHKILHNIDKFNYSKGSLKNLIGDIKSVFDAESEHGLLEENMIMALNKLLK